MTSAPVAKPQNCLDYDRAAGLQAELNELVQKFKST